MASSIMTGGVQGDNTAACSPRCTIQDDGDNLATDPLFVSSTDPDGADDLWGTADDGLTLMMGSPAHDSGTDRDVYDIDLDEDTAEAVPDIANVDGDGDRAEPVPSDLAGRARTVDVIDRGPYERP